MKINFCAQKSCAFFVNLFFQVVQRHLATKHQIKREESPTIPYQQPTNGIKAEQSAVVTKMEPFMKKRCLLLAKNYQNIHFLKYGILNAPVGESSKEPLIM